MYTLALSILLTFQTESFKLDFAVANADMNSWYREEMKQKVSDLTSKLDSRIFCPDTKGKKRCVCVCVCVCVFVCVCVCV